MKRIWKVLLGVLCVLALWVGIFLGVGLKLGDLTVWAMGERYKLLGYAQTDTVLMGSSTMQKWQTSQADLGPMETVNVGVGGSVIRNWGGWMDKLVLPFQPKNVVVYVGANDLHNEKKSGAETFVELKVLLEQLHDKLPDAMIYYVSVYTTGAFPELMEEDKALGALTMQLAEECSYLTFIDCDTPLCDETGQARQELFEADMVHLNTEGYRVWSETIRAALLSDGEEGAAA